ncbi:hypothetical protein ACLI4Y_11460 [Natrialbaceae archaeon A-CW3]
MKPTFEPITDGLEIIDRIERHRYQLTTHRSVSPKPIAPERIQFPVDAAVQITTDAITLPTNDLPHVRDENGALLDDIGNIEQTVLEDGQYTLDISAPFKIYIRVESSIHLYFDTERTYIGLEEDTPVLIGVRSYHTRPAATITTTSDPEDVMEAVTMFGSALKTKTPERSYPTLRGHPPALERGDELHIPESLERPDTGVTIEVPRRLEDIYVVTPLAYYLGAAVRPGPDPQIVTESGFTHSLTGTDGFETTVEKTLKHLFFLDCVARTEGTTPVPLQERYAVEPNIEFDLATTYDRPIHEQVETYLSVPFKTIEPHLPEWRLETHLPPTADAITFLPFVTDDLAIVRIQETESAETTTDQEEITAIKAFTRGSFVRSADSDRGSTVDTKHVETPTMPTITQSWRSDRSAEIVSTTPVSAFHHSNARTPRTDPIEIAVVCNDPEMREELETVNGIYGDRAELPFTVSVNYELSRAELESVLADESDFFHYIGHIDEGGFQCTDGKLSASSLEHVGAKAFLLNACQSHNQGLYLIEAGSIGGVVTLGDVINSGAISVGSQLARLLNRGYPLYAALEIARKESFVGQQYRLVGDGLTTIAQAETGTPTFATIEPADEGFEVGLELYVPTGMGKGALYMPYLDSTDSYFLTPGNVGPFTVTAAQLDAFLNLEEIPILLNDTLLWSHETALTNH